MSASRMPTLFVSHGSPTFALEPGETGPALRQWGAELKARGGLRGVLIMSPHWMAHMPEVMTQPRPPTWHDFGGFPEPLYRLQYPAPGSPALAQTVMSTLQAAGLPVHADPERPFDHGAWVPLMHLFPEADVPVVQLALPARDTPQQLYALGQALSGLRDQGILIIGSGSMTHNLREFFVGRPEFDAPAAPYAVEFSRWVESTLMAQERERLFDYRAQAPHAARAHPSDEHYVTLYFAAGAGGWGQPDAAAPQYLSREVMYGSLAMDAVVFP